MKIKKSKLAFLSTISLGLISIIASNTLILASCSATITEEEERINKGNGDQFANNEKAGVDAISSTLESVVKDSLSSETSMGKILEGKISNLFYKTIQEIAKTNATFSKDLKNKEKEIDEEYKQLIESAKKTETDWEKYFQDTNLDPNGGTEESYKEIKKNEWSLNYLIDKIFEKSHIYVSNGTNIIKTPQLSDLMNALNKQNSFKFIWTGENDLDKFYATIQEFVFNKWLEFEKPIIVNMSLWKYGTPKGGINSLYNTNLTPPEPPPEGEGDGETGTPPPTRDSSSIAATYAFPYFSSSSDNETFSSIEKFNNFIKDSKATPNYKLPTIGGVANTAGLIDIPNNYTEDSSTYILAKTSSIFNDLYPEFAMATLASFYDQWTTTDKLLNPSFSKEINITESVLDDITKQFISETTFPNSIPQTTIKTKLVNEIINQFGDLTTLRGKDLYSIDAFKIKDATANGSYSLSDFTLLRNEAGVHAISIDGFDHIKTSANQNAAITKYGDVILYRYILSERSLTNLPGNEALSIDLKTELKTYFTNNKEYLMTELLQSVEPSIVNIVTKYFSNNYMTDATDKLFFKSLSNYLFNLKNNDLNWKVQEKFRSTKEIFSNNFGSLASNNGFASPWIYNQNTTSGLFNITTLYDSTIPVYGANSYRENYLKNIDTYITSLNIGKLTSNASTFKYSQYIYSSDFYINLSLKEYMTSSGDEFSNKLKSEVLKRNVSEYFGADLNFNGLGLSTENLGKLNYQMKELYYASTFNEIQGNKFIYWSKFNKTALGDTITASQLNTYKDQLYNQIIDENKLNVYGKLLDVFLVASTINYLLETPQGDTTNRFMQHLQDEVIFGKDYYFVWSDGLNGKLEDTNRNITTSNLLNVNRMKVNNNNNYASKYFSNNGTLLSDTIGDNLYASSTYGVGDNHYNAMPIDATNTYLGYYGLSSSSSSLPSVISEKLFNSPREGSTAAQTNMGLLYQYGSKAGLEKHIDDIRYISDLESLANDISNELSGGFDIDKINSAVTIDDKKTAFKTELNGINANAFTKFTGVVSEKILPDTSTSNYYGAYAKQINFNDVLQPFNTFITQQGADIVFNLLIKTAMDEKYKNIVLNEIAQNNKFKIFDINAKNALGSLWIKDDEETTN